MTTQSVQPETVTADPLERVYVTDADDNRHISMSYVWALEAALRSEIERGEALREALRDIEVYPVGDSGFQDVARAALAQLEEGPQ